MNELFCVPVFLLLFLSACRPTSGVDERHERCATRRYVPAACGLVGIALHCWALLTYDATYAFAAVYAADVFAVLFLTTLGVTCAHAAWLVAMCARQCALPRTTRVDVIVRTLLVLTLASYVGVWMQGAHLMAHERARVPREYVHWSPAELNTGMPYEPPLFRTPHMLPE